MNTNTIIAKANNFVQEAKLAAKKGENVSSAKKNNLLTSLGTLFLKGVPYENFQKTYEELNQVTNIA